MDEPMTEADISLPFGPLACASCGAPIRELGGMWRETRPHTAEPFCQACVEPSKEENDGNDD